MRITYELPMPPATLIERLRTETIPYAGIVDLTSPLKGYQRFLKESLTGKSTVVAIIEDRTFRLVPIGAWPVKGKSPLAVVGGMHGEVEECGGRSRLHTQFNLAFVSKACIAGMALVSTACLSLMAVVAVLGIRMEGLPLLWGLTGASCLVTVYVAGYVLLGARTQKRVLREFLETFVRRIASDDEPGSAVT